MSASHLFNPDIQRVLDITTSNDGTVSAPSKRSLHAVVDKCKSLLRKGAIRNDVFNRSRRQIYIRKRTVLSTPRAMTFSRTRPARKITVIHGDLLDAFDRVSQQCLIVHNMMARAVIEDPIASISVHLRRRLREPYRPCFS